MRQYDADTTFIDGKSELGRTIGHEFLCLGLMN